LIEGERIRLRAIERSDLAQFVRWLNDSDVRAGLDIFLPFSLDEEERWYERMLETPADEHPLAIEARDGDAWRSIGDCGFHSIDWRSRSAETGIVIGDKNYWNQGYGTDAMQLLLKHGFDTLNLNRIYLRVFSNNARAIRCYEKAGFVQEGRFRQAHYQDGEYQDVLVMSVLRSEWVG
jgi:RimJ/RimL family protein N-acetyltransferase